MKIWMVGIMGLACSCADITSSFASVVAPVDLRCEYLANPMGIDSPVPRLSWKLYAGNREFEILNSKEMPRGVKQTAYQVLAASSEERLKEGKADLWDSGKMESDQSLHVEYAGKPLSSRMQCFWKVRVWTVETEGEGRKSGDGKKSEWSESSSWTMGLLKPNDWQQAKWIRAPAGLGGAVSEPEVTAQNLKKATYRTLDGKVSVDVTENLRKELRNAKPFTVNPRELGGDPAPGVVKELVAEFVKEGRSRTLSAKDFAPLTPITESGRPLAQAPGVKFVRMENGAAVFAVRSGCYEFRSLSYN